jgi:hypothetical protein
MQGSKAVGQRTPLAPNGRLCKPSSGARNVELLCRDLDRGAAVPPGYRRRGQPRGRCGRSQRGYAADTPELSLSCLLHLGGFMFPSPARSTNNTTFVLILIAAAGGLLSVLSPPFLSPPAVPDPGTVCPSLPPLRSPFVRPSRARPLTVVRPCHEVCGAPFSFRPFILSHA